MKGSNILGKDKQIFIAVQHIYIKRPVQMLCLICEKLL